MSRYLTLAEVRAAVRPADPELEAQLAACELPIANGYWVLLNGAGRVHAEGPVSPESDRAIDDVARAAFARLALEGGR